MALARIFSASPEHAAALIRDLERQGYEVEVIRPDETPSGPADLEIQYELCDTDRVVERANELASALQADIAVGTGVLGAAPMEPVREEFPSTITEAPASEICRETGEAQEVMLETNAAAREEDRAAAILVTPEVDAAETPAGPHPAMAAWSRGVTTLAAFAGNSLDSAHRLWLAAVHKMREQRERAAIRAAEARAHREQQLLELTCRRAETLQRSRQIEAARRAAAGYLSQLQNEARDQKDSQKGDTIAAVTSYPRAKKGWGWWAPSEHMKTIAAAATAAGALFAFTLGISALRSKPAPVKSAAPAPAPVVTLQSSRITSPAAPQRPSPAARQALQRPAPSRATHASASRAVESDDGDVADDVVIRHFAPAKSPQSRSRGSNAVKHYSDIDNQDQGR
jgi:hypothetical protein